MAGVAAPEIRAAGPRGEPEEPVEDRALLDVALGRQERQRGAAVQLAEEPAAPVAAQNLTPTERPRASIRSSS